MNASNLTSRKLALVLLPAALLTLLGLGLVDAGLTQKLFIQTTYFFLMAAVLCWAGTYLHAAREVDRDAVVTWTKAHWPGLVIAAAVTLVAWVAIEPALRILSD